MHSQERWTVRLDWGLEGAREVAAGADVAVVVDVLSFTTTLSVAADLGTVVLPWAHGRAGAAAHARTHDAVLAGPRTHDGGPSLSPASLRRGTPPERLVLPSPNGAAISAGLAGAATHVVGACLRNADAVARWVASLAPSSVAVVAAGERRSDGSLRPSAEDLWGAGAVVAALARAGLHDASPEARSAVGAHDAVAGDLPAALADCATGRELAAAGFACDVAVAAETISSTAVPVLTRRGEYVPHR